MLLEQLFNQRLFNDPAQAQSPSHRLLLRGGYIHELAPGVFALSPLGSRVVRRLEMIVREELDALEGQEIRLPLVTQASLQQKAQLSSTEGPISFEDHSRQTLLLNGSHEATIVEMARSYISSYRQLPLLTYTLSSVFRDHSHSRGGLLQARDTAEALTCSFHREQEDLDYWTQKLHTAYHRMFQRCGLLNLTALQEGEDGPEGNLTHHFFCLNEAGSEALLVCEASGYEATIATATAGFSFGNDEEWQPLRMVQTPNTKTIAELATFLDVEPAQCCKAVALVNEREELLVVFVRGDFEVNLHKIREVTESTQLRPATERECRKAGLVAGYIGPVGLERRPVRRLFDPSVAYTPNLVIGANSLNKHRTGFTFERDVKEGEIHDLIQVRIGDPCPISGEALEKREVIPLATIRQHGSRLTRALQHSYNEEDGSKRHALVGSSTLDLGTMLSTVVEENSDDYGPIWPSELAPYRVHICCLQSKDEEVRLCAHELYRSLRHRGIEVILDTRKVRAGVMFSDADLIGAPIRAVLSPRNLKRGVVELKYRLTLPEQRDDLPSEMAIFDLVDEAESLLDDLLSASVEFFL
jgi:prolyl-tRNA synthetase